MYGNGDLVFLTVNQNDLKDVRRGMPPSSTPLSPPSPLVVTAAEVATAKAHTLTETSSALTTTTRCTTTTTTNNNNNSSSINNAPSSVYQNDNPSSPSLSEWIDDGTIASTVISMSVETDVMLPLPRTHASASYDRMQHRQELKQRQQWQRRWHTMTMSDPDHCQRHQQENRPSLPIQIRQAIVSLRRFSSSGWSDSVQRNGITDIISSPSFSPSDVSKLYWEDLEDDLFLLLNGHQVRFHLFRNMFFDPIWSSNDDDNASPSSNSKVTFRQLSELSRSLAYLLSSCSSSSSYSSCCHDMKLHDEHVLRLATFFASSIISGPTTIASRGQKVSVVDCLVRCLFWCDSRNTDDDFDNNNSGSNNNNRSDQNVDIGLGSPLAQVRQVEQSDTVSPTTAEKFLDFLKIRQAQWPLDEILPAQVNNDSCNDSGDDDGGSLLKLMTTMYEIRAQCLRVQEGEYERRIQRLKRVSESSDEAAMIISASAKLVEFGIHKSNTIIERKIESAGQAAKQWVDVDDEPLILNRDAVVAMAFSETAKRASEYAREGTSMAIDSILDVSISGLKKVGQHLVGDRNGNSTDDDTDSNRDNDRVEDHDDEGICVGCSPLNQRERREILRAAGKVGMATVGAAALVSEAVARSSRSVVIKTAGVAADVVGHKYGTTAGDVVKNAGDTAGNLVRVAGHVALLDSSVLAKHVAKTASKAHVDYEAQRAKQRIEEFEKRFASMMSNTLGVQIEGNWVGQIESFSNQVEKSNLRTDEVIVFSGPVDEAAPDTRCNIDIIDGVAPSSPTHEPVEFFEVPSHVNQGGDKDQCQYPNTLKESTASDTHSTASTDNTSILSS